MKKYAVMVLAVMLIGVMASGASSGVVYGESGWETQGKSEETAWEINSPEVLMKMRDDVNSGKITHAAYYKLTSDINLTDYANWIPIGGAKGSPYPDIPSKKFIGHFDGNGHTVKVNMLRNGEYCNTGLFGWIRDGGSIKNLSVSGNVVVNSTSILGNTYVGGIATDVDGGTIENCTFDGTVKGSNSNIGEAVYVGGIVGNAGGNETTIITGCKVGSMSATSIGASAPPVGLNDDKGYEGGIIGKLYDGSSTRVTDNYANVTLSGNCDHSGAIYGARTGLQGVVKDNTTGNSGNNGGNSDNNDNNENGGEDNNSGNNNGGGGGNNDNNDGNSGNGSITINGSFPDGTVNTAYQASVTVSGGTSPYEWTYSGTPPTGTTLSLGDSTETAYLTGTPTTAGTYTFSLTVTDSNSRETSKSFAVTISGSNGGGGGGGGGGGCNSGFAVLAFALSALITLRKSRN